MRRFTIFNDFSRKPLSHCLKAQESAALSGMEDIDSRSHNLIVINYGRLLKISLASMIADLTMIEIFETVSL